MEMVSDAELPRNTLLLGSSGSHHHLTYGLVSDIDEDRIGYIHIDNHSDAPYRPEKTEKNVLHSCFTSDIYELEHVGEALLIGSSYAPFRSVSRKELLQDDYNDLVDEHLRAMPDRVYVSVDLDVLNRNHVSTRFSQGDMDFKQLEEILGRITSEKDVVGADIFGLDSPVRVLDLLTYRAVVKTLMGELGEGERQAFLEDISETETLPEGFHRDRLSRLGG